MVDLEPLDGAEDVELVRDLIERHVGYTGSTVAARLLARLGIARPRFVKVMPRDYKRVLHGAGARDAARSATSVESRRMLARSANG